MQETIDHPRVEARPIRQRAAEPTGAFAAALIVTATIYVLRLDEVAGLFVDDAWYALLGKALATGQGYQLINSPSPGITPIYPPLYPFLLSLVYRVSPAFPDNVRSLKTISIAAMLLAGAATYRHFRRDRHWPLLHSFLAALVVMLAPALVFLATSTTMSECVFTALQMASVLAVESAVRGARGPRQAIVAGGGGALAGMTFLTRSIGAYAIAAGLGYLLVRRRWSAASAFALAAVLIAAPWAVHSRTHRPSAEQQREQGGMIVQDYSAQLRQRRAGTAFSGTADLPGLLRRLHTNAAKIAGNNLAMLFAPPLYRSPRISGEETLEQATQLRLLSYPLAFFVLLGFALSLRGGLRAADLLVVFALPIVLIWPWEPFRFLLPLVPFLLHYLLAGIGAAANAIARVLRPTPAAGHGAAALGAGLILAAYLLDHAAYVARRSDPSPAESLPWRAIFAETQQVLRWVREQTPHSAVIASPNPALVHLHTGRKSVACENPAASWENWKRLNVRYMALLSAHPLGDPPPAEAQFHQAYVSSGYLKLRVVDLGPPEERPPWNLHPTQRG